MKPPIPIAVALHLALASASLHAGEPAHALQPNAPRTVVVSEAQTPPVIRAGLLQSTLIVLPAEEKVANVFAGDTVDWVFDGGHLASRFISVKPRTAGSTTDMLLKDSPQPRVQRTSSATQESLPIPCKVS